MRRVTMELWPVTSITTEPEQLGAPERIEAAARQGENAAKNTRAWLKEAKESKHEKKQRLLKSAPCSNGRVHAAGAASRRRDALRRNRKRRSTRIRHRYQIGGGDGKWWRPRRGPGTTPPCPLRMLSSSSTSRAQEQKLREDFKRLYKEAVGDCPPFGARRVRLNAPPCRISTDDRWSAPDQWSGRPGPRLHAHLRPSPGRSEHYHPIKRQPISERVQEAAPTYGPAACRWPAASYGPRRHAAADPGRRSTSGPPLPASTHGRNPRSGGPCGRRGSRAQFRRCVVPRQSPAKGILWVPRL